MRIAAIGNPVSGRGRAEGVLKGLVSFLSRRGHSVETLLTKGPGCAQAQAGELEGSFDRLVVAGGDGTISDAVNGLQDPSSLPILPIGVGTANMLCRELNLPNEPEKLTRIIEDGTVKCIDMATAGDRRFLLVAGAGFDGTVTKILSEQKRGRLGYRGYVKPIMDAIALYEPIEMDVQVDDGDPVKGYNVIVSKVRRYGGYFVFTDNASLDSGDLEVIVFPSGSIPSVIGYSMAAFLRKIDRLEGVMKMRGRKVRIDSAEPVPIQLDGDYYGTTPVTLEIKPASVPVLTGLN